MQMDVNPAGEVYSILRDNPIPLVISTITPGSGTWHHLSLKKIN
jgi:hypothetical protein